MKTYTLRKKIKHIKIIDDYKGKIVLFYGKSGICKRCWC